MGGGIDSRFSHEKLTELLSNRVISLDQNTDTLSSEGEADVLHLYLMTCISL